jgi:Family of unknown function (DUF5906)
MTAELNGPNQPTPPARGTLEWWRGHLNGFREPGRASWHVEYLGPPPDHPDCKAPQELLTEFGYRERTTADEPVGIFSTSPQPPDVDRNAAPTLAMEAASIAPSDELPMGYEHKISVDFLKQLRPNGPWVLSAIGPDDKKITTTTVRTPKEADEFIRRYNGKRNLYYSVNPTRRQLDRKAAKTDIAAIEYMLADLDPRKGESSQEAKERYLQQLNGTFEPKPTAVVDSGNGIQCLWKLKTPIILGEPVSTRTANGEAKLAFSPEDQAKIKDVEERVAAIMHRLGSVAGTQNIDRILRVPGTINLPNEVKRKAGRSSCPSELLWFTGVSYQIDAFPRDEPEDMALLNSGIPLDSFQIEDLDTQRDEAPDNDTKGRAGDGETDARGDHHESIDIDALHVSERIKRLIRGIDDPDHPYNSRSEKVFAVLVAMAAAGHTDEQMTAVMLDNALPIGVHVRVQRKPREYLPRQIKRARELAADPEVTEINKTYAVMPSGGRVAIMRQFRSPEGEFEFDLLTPASFKTLLANRHVMRGKKRITLAEHWLRHPQRQEYKGLTFAPGREVPGYFNLWRGFAVQPAPGDCSKFLAHLRDNVCCGDEAVYRWVLGWFAQMFQHPDRKMGTSLVIRGKQGTGKTKVGDIIGSLLKQHYVIVSDPRYITGRFNSHLTRCLMLHADEGFWAGDHVAEGKLKDLVTGQDHLIEFKGKEPIRVRNYVRLLITGNPDWVVPAEMEDRRFAVLDIGEACIKNHSYFAAIDAEMDNGGRAALLDYLLHYDLTGIDLRTTPKTGALLEQKINSLTPEHGWLLDVLHSGRLRWGGKEPGCCPTELLFDHYIKHSTSTGVRRRSTETKIGIFLKKVLPGIRKSEGMYKAFGPERYGSIYEFPPLKECRTKFARLLQTEVDWGEPTEWLPDPEGDENSPY